MMVNRDHTQGRNAHGTGFSKRPPSINGAQTKETCGRMMADAKPVIFGENGATSTQRRKAIDTLCSLASSPRTSSKCARNWPQNKVASEYETEERLVIRSEHPSKRRKGTPHKPTPFVHRSPRKDFPTNIRRTSVSPMAKSLFGCPPTNSISCVVPKSEQSVDDEDDDIWQAARSMNLNDQLKYYWSLCYGSNPSENTRPQDLNGSCSAHLNRPLKGCLATNSSSSAIHHRSALFFTSPSMDEEDDAVISSMTTPRASPGSLPQQELESPLKNARRVQFGPTQAAEYDSTDPAQALTPIPADLAEWRYPTIASIPTVEEEKLLQETKNNTALLEEWDQDDDESNEFFTLSQPSDDSSEEGSLTDYIDSEEIERYASSNLDRKKRRSSSFFQRPSKYKNGGLIDSCDEENGNLNGMEDSPQSIVKNNAMDHSVCNTPSLHKLSLDSPDHFSDAGAHSFTNTDQSYGNNSTNNMNAVDLVRNSKRKQSITRPLHEGGHPEEAQLMDQSRQKEIWSQYFLSHDENSLPTIVTGHPHLLWPFISRSAKVLHSHQSSQSNLWLERICRSATLLHFVEKVLNEMDLATSKSMPWELFLPALAKNLALESHFYEKRVKEECTRIETLSSTAKRHIHKWKNLGKQKFETEKDAQILKAKIRIAKRRVSLIRCNHEVRNKLCAAQMNFLKHDFFRAIFAPISHQFISDEMFQIRFDSNACSISEYAPGSELRITGNVLSSKATTIQLVASCHDSSYSERVNEINYLQHNLIRELLEREIAALQQEETNCQETVLQWILFLGCLERHYFANTQLFQHQSE